ncbi:hypothetical protein SO802_006151 [Lithocarpus litseifolius]|uniref:Uncharacterized protein n=1 Tax=Lithocarpus litseifolius TaxID=425828 RepID=A0AAW2DK62_9ROSI
MSLGSNWDACPIMTLLEVVESVMSCGTTVQVSFSHKCSQLSWCRVLNVEVMATFSRYFLSSLLAVGTSELHQAEKHVKRAENSHQNTPQQAPRLDSPGLEDSRYVDALEFDFVSAIKTKQWWRTRQSDKTKTYSSLLLSNQ